MQHPLHEDRAGLSTSSDRDSPSATNCSWAAAPSCSSIDHMQAAAAPPPGGFFRQLFAEDTGASPGRYVEDLLQLQLPSAAEAVPPFDLLSSSDMFHPRHGNYTSSQLQSCVGDFHVPPTFSVESYINDGNSACATLNTNDHVPHTLEFVTPPTSSSSGLTFRSSGSISRPPDAAAASAMLADVELSPSDSPHYADHHEGAHHSKPGLVNADECRADQAHAMSHGHAAASSCKKAKLQAASDQCSSAGTDSSQFQAMMISKSARSKEKLGERINALQQLVSPFGKTDTASVLSEAIGYIKFLQEQVQVLSSPYMKPSTSCTPGLTASSRQDVKETESASDLRSRGLCLVPVSCTMNVANNNNFNIGADYWASTPSMATTTRFSANS